MVTDLDAALATVAGADAAALADPDSPEHAQAMAALDELSAKLEAAAAALASTSREDLPPEIRAALAELVAQAQAIVDGLVSQHRVG